MQLPIKIHQYYFFLLPAYDKNAKFSAVHANFSMFTVLKFNTITILSLLNNYCLILMM